MEFEENEWFRSCLSNIKQYVSVNCNGSILACVLYGVPQGSFLNTILSLMHINDVNQTIKVGKVHLFADELIYLNK